MSEHFAYISLLLSVFFFLVMGVFFIFSCTDSDFFRGGGPRDNEANFFAMGMAVRGGGLILIFGNHTKKYVI